VSDIVIPDPEREEEFHQEPVYSVSMEDESKITDRVSISFKNFIDLLASHSYGKIVENDEYANSKMTVSSDLLSVLANAHETRNEKKLPLIFSIGLIVGVIIAYLVIRY
jgi:hypothetical protein